MHGRINNLSQLLKYLELFFDTDIMIKADASPPITCKLERLLDLG